MIRLLVCFALPHVGWVWEAWKGHTGLMNIHGKVSPGPQWDGDSCPWPRRNKADTCNKGTRKTGKQCWTGWCSVAAWGSGPYNHRHSPFSSHHALSNNRVCHQSVSGSSPDLQETQHYIDQPTNSMTQRQAKMEDTELTLGGRQNELLIFGLLCPHD